MAGCDERSSPAQRGREVQVLWILLLLSPLASGLITYAPSFANPLFQGCTSTYEPPNKQTNLEIDLETTRLRNIFWPNGHGNF